MLYVGAVMRLVVLFVVPQVAGWLVTRRMRHFSGLAWPATAIAVCGVIWRVCTWEPAREVGRVSHTRCGTDLVGLYFAMGAALVVHLNLGVLFGLLSRRRREMHRLGRRPSAALF